MNSRLDTIQAAVLSIKLEHLDAWNDLRRRAADTYRRLLHGIDGIVLPVELAANQHVWHLFTVQVEHRDAVLGTLHDRGIGAAIHYPFAVHQTPAFARRALTPVPCPVAEWAVASTLSLPMFPGITDEQQQRVAAVLASAVGGRAR